MDPPLSVVPPNAKPSKKQKRRKPCAGGIIPYKPFLRLIRELAFEIRPDTRITRPHIDVYAVGIDRDSVLLLRTATEAHVSRLFESANKCAVHARRLTVQELDVMLANNLIRPDHQG